MKRAKILVIPALFALVVCAWAGNAITGYSNSRILSHQYTPVGNVGTGEDDLMSYTVPANTLDADGEALRVRAAFSVASNSGSRTVKFHFGATSVSVLANGAGANGSTVWVDAQVIRTGSATQLLLTNGQGEFNGGITTYIDATAAAETLSGAVALKFTGQDSNNNDDEVVQKYMLVEHLPLSE